MIIWLASYPKSGNTWVRALLTSYYFSKKGDFNFQLLKKIEQFPSVNHYKNDKDLYLKPESNAEKWLSKQKEINKDNKIRFFKTHNANCIINGNKFTDNQNTLGAIYIVRDPRNVITSLKHHYQISNDDALLFMRNNKKILFEKQGNRYLGFTPLFSWSTHVDSWINCKSFPILNVRYEDLQFKTFETLKIIINFIKKISKSTNLFDRERAKNSIKACDFANLKNLEKKNGFDESIVKKDGSMKINFFNLGQDNDYKKILKPDLINEMNEIYNKQLLKFSYEKSN